MYNIEEEVIRGVEEAINKTPVVEIAEVNGRQRVSASIESALLGEISVDVDFDPAIYAAAQNSMQTAAYVVAQLVARLHGAIVTRAVE